MLIIALLCLFVICGLFLWISYTDIKKRIIHNEAVIALLFAILPFSWMIYGEIFIIPAVITFVVGFLLFMAKVIGGGDVKMLAVLMLGVPPEAVMPFLFFTTFAGLLVIIMGFIVNYQAIKKRGLPYGVAIALGFIAQLILYFPYEKWLIPVT